MFQLEDKNLYVPTTFPVKSIDIKKINCESQHTSRRCSRNGINQRGFAEMWQSWIQGCVSIACGISWRSWFAQAFHVQPAFRGRTKHLHTTSLSVVSLSFFTPKQRFPFALFLWLLSLSASHKPKRAVLQTWNFVVGRIFVPAVISVRLYSAALFEKSHSRTKRRWAGIWSFKLGVLLQLFLGYALPVSLTRFSDSCLIFQQDESGALLISKKHWLTAAARSSEARRGLFIPAI